MLNNLKAYVQPITYDTRTLIQHVQLSNNHGPKGPRRGRRGETTPTLGLQKAGTESLMFRGGMEATKVLEHGGARGCWSTTHNRGKTEELPHLPDVHWVESVVSKGLKGAHSSNRGEQDINVS